MGLLRLASDMCMCVCVCVNVTAETDILYQKLTKSEATEITCGEEFKLIVELLFHFK